VNLISAALSKNRKIRFLGSLVINIIKHYYPIMMSSSPRPQYFVAREDGTLTPLIAVDELPETVQIAGVPATLSPAGTMNMTSLGLKERSTNRYTVSYLGAAGPSATPSETTASAEETDRPIEEIGAPATKATKKGGRFKLAGMENWRQGVKKDVANEGEGNGVKDDHGKIADTSEEVHEGIKGAGEESKSPDQSPKMADAIPSLAGGAGAGTKGTLGRKMYCTHWIRWGECDYTQQGCLYKHEMPDEDKLHEIGIATYPRWYRIAHPEKFGGFTEVPEWHRRPGPAPTDQLWRGGTQARGMPSQSFEDFRQNATVQRPPTGTPTANMGSPTFIVSPYPGNFNPFVGGFTPQPHMQPHARQQWNNQAPGPRIVNMDSSLVNKSIPKSGVNKHNVVTAPASAAQAITDPTTAAATQSDNSVKPPHSSNRVTKSIPRSSSTPDQPENVGSETILNNSQLRSATSSIHANQQESTAANGAHSTNFPSRPRASGFQFRTGTRHSSTGSRAPSVVNEAYHPLVPSPNSQQQAANNIRENGLEKPETSQAPVLHRRFFVPAGEPHFVASPAENPPPKKLSDEGSPAEKSHKGKKGGRKMDKMNMGPLVDV